jgi:hypothetical protein
VVEPDDRNAPPLERDVERDVIRDGLDEPVRTSHNATTRQRLVCEDR